MQVKHYHALFLNGTKSIISSTRSIHNNPSKKNKFLFLVGLLFLNLYFIAQLFLGQNSIIYQKKLRQIKLEKSYVLEKLKCKNEAFQLELSLISETKIDVDYLDELARKKLNYSSGEEMVLVY